MIKEYLTTKNITFAVLVIALLFIIPKIIGILLLFFGAYVIACALVPFINKLEKKMRRGFAVTLTVFGGILSIIAIFLPIFFVAYKEIKTFITFLPEKLTLVTNYLMNWEFHGKKLANLFDINSIMGASSTSEFAHGIFSQSWNLTVGFFQFLVVTVALTMIVYYILMDKTYLKSKFLEFFPANLKDKANLIIDSISRKVGGYVRAQILSMVAVGIMITVVLLMLGVDYPILLGLIAGVMDIIPLLGPTVALGVILLVAAPLGSVKVILAILGFLLVQQISNYVVRPVLFGKFMSLHPLMIFLALFAAEQFLGFWGVILSPAIAATICVLIDELYILPINNNEVVENA